MTNKSPLRSSLCIFTAAMLFLSNTCGVAAGDLYTSASNENVHTAAVSADAADTPVALAGTAGELEELAGSAERLEEPAGLEDYTEEPTTPAGASEKPTEAAEESADLSEGIDYSADPSDASESAAGSESLEESAIFDVENDDSLGQGAEGTYWEDPQAGNGGEDVEYGQEEDPDLWDLNSDSDDLDAAAGDSLSDGSSAADPLDEFLPGDEDMNELAGESDEEELLLDITETAVIDDPIWKPSQNRRPVDRI